MTINEAHMRATAGDRMLRIKGHCTGLWYQDHILEFVSEHKDDECRVLLENKQLITVELMKEA